MYVILPNREHMGTELSILRSRLKKEAIERICTSVSIIHV